VRRYNDDTPTPPFLAAPEGTRLVCALGEEDLRAASALEGDASDESAIRNATVCVGARDREGRLVAMARALSDTRSALVWPTCVAEGWRDSAARDAVRDAVTRLLFAHPAIRRASITRAAQEDLRVSESTFRSSGNPSA
jgi:hypothetical protein